MKRLKSKYLVVAAFALLSFMSCDFLEKEPDTELAMDIVFDDKNKVEGVLGYVYNGLPTPGDYTHGLGWSVWGDELVWNRLVNWGVLSVQERLFNGTWNVATAPSWNMWNEYPKRIRHAYLFQEKAHEIAGLPQETIDRMKAECRYLACYYWWHLTENYGPIPFIPEMFSTDVPLAEMQKARTSFDDIVSYLDKELLAVSELLPDKYTATNEYGHATSIMALTTRARMLLFAASPLVNGNSWYKDWTNVDGSQLFSPVYDQQKWIKAAEACKLVIDRAEAAGHALFIAYNKDGSIDPFRSTRDLFFTTESAGNPEITFPMTNDLGHTNFEGYEDLCITPEFGDAGCLGVYQGLVDAYFMSNGLPAITGYKADGNPIINEESGYSEEGFTTEVTKRADTSWDEGTGVAGEVTPAGIWKMYYNREPRFYTSVSYHGSWYKVAERPFDFLCYGKDNNHQWNSPRNGYLVRRKVYQGDNSKNGIWYRNRTEWLYRLGTSYLDYAEAVNEAYDNATGRLEALKYLNHIRLRAGLRQYTINAVAANNPDYIHVDNTQDAIRNVVRMERRVEFVSEGIRWFDIRRWRIAESIPEMNGYLMGLDWDCMDINNFYKRVGDPEHNRVWKKAYYWMNIEISELEKNPNLVQAPYW